MSEFVCLLGSCCQLPGPVAVCFFTDVGLTLTLTSELKLFTDEIEVRSLKKSVEF